jgi:hypothetical protein
MPKKTKINTTKVMSSDAEGDATCLTTDSVLMLIEKIISNFTIAFNSCVGRMVDAMEKRLGRI